MHAQKRNFFCLSVPKHVPYFQIPQSHEAPPTILMEWIAGQSLVWQVQGWGWSPVRVNPKPIKLVFAVCSSLRRQIKNCGWPVIGTMGPSGATFPLRGLLFQRVVPLKIQLNGTVLFDVCFVSKTDHVCFVVVFFGGVGLRPVLCAPHFANVSVLVILDFASDFFL